MDGLFGIDPEQLKALMAQFGASPADNQAANKEALQALGFGLLQGRKGNELATIGQAGFGAMNARQASLANSGQMRQQGLQNALGMAKLAQAAQAQQQAAAQSQEMAGAFQGGPQLQNMGPGGPTPENAAAVAGPSMVDQYRKASVIAAKNGNSEAAKRYADIANQMEAEYSTTPQTMKDPSGNLASVLIGKRGETKKLDYLPAEKLHFADTGSSVLGLNPYTGKSESPALPKTMTPGETASNQVALGHLGLARNADARAAAAVGQGGKPQWDSASGQFVFPPSAPGDPGRAVTPEGFVKPPKNAPEAYSSQLAGIENLSSAMVDYKKKLKGWSNESLLSPDKRAEISTAYTDMLMQAKEAYRLGVLNGPDYQLLTSVLTDPISTRGALVSSDALDKQVTQMMGKMEVRKKNLANVYKQPYTEPAGATQSVVRRGTNAAGKRVVQYADGTIKEE